MSTELAPTAPQQPNLPAHARVIAARAKQIQDMLPATFDDKARDRFVSTLVTAVATNPKLGDCQQISLVQAAYRVAQLGLDVGINCDLIPQKKKVQIDGKDTYVMECRVSPGVKGWLKVAYESGLLASHRYGVIYRNEEYEADGNVVRMHRRMLDIAERGPLIGSYAVLDLTTGASIGRLLDLERIQRSRKMGSDFGPWRTDFAAMAEKTALLDCLKYFPFHPDLARVVGEMNAHEVEFDHGQQPSQQRGRSIPVFRPQPMQLTAAPPTPEPAPEDPNTVNVDDFTTQD